MLLVVLLEQSGTAGTAWNKCWDSLSRPSQLGTVLGELEFWDNWTVLSSAVQVRVDLLMCDQEPRHYPYIDVHCLTICSTLSTTIVLWSIAFCLWLVDLKL